MALWFDAFNTQTRQFEASVDRSILGGRLSENLGFAFTSGYQSAIEALFGTEKIVLSSLCVTEAKGNHPRSIETSLIEEEGRLSLIGKKQFVSGAGDTELMYVACKDERFGEGYDDQGRPIIKLVAVSAFQERVEIEQMPELGFIPEVSHGKVSFDQVEVFAPQILEGDGYIDYVKAFRTYEDLHVLAAIVGFRLGEALEFKWRRESVEAHLSLILSLRDLSFMPLNEPAAHIALAGCRAQLKSLIEKTDSEFQASNASGFKCWQRDQVLLSVASKAHETRTQRAWASITGS